MAMLQQASNKLLKTRGFHVDYLAHAHSRGSCRRLEFIRDELCAQLDKSLSSLEKTARARLPSAILLLRIRSSEVMRAIAREVGEDARAFQRQREIRALLCCRSAADAQLKELTSRVMFRTLFRPQTNTSSVAQTIDAPLEWTRWWKWNGMLGIASRSYLAAGRSLARALASASNFADLKRSERYPSNDKTRGASVSDKKIANYVSMIRDRYRDRNLQVFGRAPAKPDDLALELLRIVEEFVALRLLEASLARRTGKENVVYPQGNRENSNLAKIIEAGMDLAEQVIARDHSTSAHHTIQAHWCESRLLMHKSVCAISRADWSEAMKLLGDADACLNYHDAKRQSTDRAVIELHRAEVRLREANAEVIVDAKKRSASDELSFRTLCEEASKRPFARSLLWRSAAPGIRKSLFHDIRRGLPEGMLDDPMVGASLTKVRSHVQDAMRFLARAEQLLLARRRNVWWTTWYFQRKLEAICMTVWSSLAEKGTPIPFLGLEAAPRKTPTEADTLLEDSLRMIRVDAYRLATVVDSYRSTAIALHTRLLLDSESMRLPERQRRMHTQLTMAAEKLKTVLMARQNWFDGRAERRSGAPDLGPGEKAKSDAKLDPRLEAYIEGVLTRCDAAAEFLVNPLY
jgi:hypothetical protein